MIMSQVIFPCIIAAMNTQSFSSFSFILILIVKCICYEFIYLWPTSLVWNMEVILVTCFYLHCYLANFKGSGSWCAFKVTTRTHYNSTHCFRKYKNDHKAMIEKVHRTVFTYLLVKLNREMLFGCDWGRWLLDQITSFCSRVANCCT